MNAVGATAAPHLDHVQGNPDGAGPLVVLLHGLGGNSGVWAGLTPLLQGRRWLALDLPGHGRSDPLPVYGYREVAEAVHAALPGDEEIALIGHSFGGAVGLVLAGMRPLSAVVSVGLRADWPASFVQVLQTLGTKPPRWFDQRADAAHFLLHINALTGLVDQDGDFVRRGLQHRDRRWAAAVHPPAFAVGPPPFEALLGGAGDTPLTLAHGQDDVMIAVGDYDRFRAWSSVAVVVLPGLSHNAHAQDPGAVAALLRA
ncbi:MAG: alpha/beta hydrolase [Geodermatophilaceae bacterium]|nr:alpha/beta hydrolase [Geodermatophilaceae bacterium]